VHPLLFIQPYAEYVFALQNALFRFEPEVALAIALGREPPHHDDPPEGPDSFLADNGFEYIDGECTRHPEMPSASATVENGGDGDDDDVQGLPRVIDALSTIMWPTMVRREQNGSGERKARLQPSLFDFDDVRRAENEGEEDEEATLAALMAADAADHGLPLTRASRMQREMQTLERWLVENEEMHEAEFGHGTGTDDDEEDESKDDDDDNDKDGGGDAPLSSLQAPVLDIRAPSKDDDPWVASSASNPTPSTAQQRSTAAPSSGSGFDDDFSAFVSAPPAISFPVRGPTSAWAPSTSGSIIAPARPPHDVSQSLLKPSYTGGSFRSPRSAASDVDFGDDDLGYEALDDRSSLNFSPEHEHDRGARAFDGDAEPSTSTSQRFGGRAAGLGDVPFDLTNILSTLDTMREDMAGIEDEGERRARTARFASEFVFKTMNVDGDKEIED
jgi:hypothetical protein